MSLTATGHEFHADGTMCFGWVCKCRGHVETLVKLEEEKAKLLARSEKLYISKLVIQEEVIERNKDLEKGTDLEKSTNAMFLELREIGLKVLDIRIALLEKDWKIWAEKFYRLRKSRKDSIEKS